MIKLGKLALVATLAVPGVAFAEINIGDEIGVSETAIRATLEAQGYTISEVETEDGEIEVEADIAGQSFEIEVSSETGMVLAVNEDDDDEDEG
ncbi:PepSY domain-containing protein [Phaeobacter sp. C3_T13_0]|uniref:PepSY domain-containing protein n=1 Tax=Phaeobacter cretensis TaxID=3342641 RepID=UPI0039BC668B